MAFGRLHAEERQVISKAINKVKRHGNLYGKFSDANNIENAARMSPHYKPENAADVCALLERNDFQPSESYNVTINDGKERLLTILPENPDKVIHRALLLILRPIWDKVFIADSYCGIRGRGQLPAALKTRRYIQEARKTGPVYCLKFDMRKFYPTIKHDVLKALVRRSIKDKQVLRYLDAIIDSEEGIMLGSPISPYLANLYITYLCHRLKEKRGAKWLINYADDFIILSNNKSFLHRLLAEIEEYTTNQLKIEVKRNKQIFPVALNRSDRHGRGIDFLGFVFFLNETRLRKGIKQALCRKIAKLRKAKKPITRKAFLQAIAPWWGWLKYSDSEYLIQQLNKISPYEIKFRC